MGFNRPTIEGHSSAFRPAAGHGFVVGNGASDPLPAAQGGFGGFVVAAQRKVTGGGVPFLRVTIDQNVNLSRFAVQPTLRGDTLAHPQVTSLTATVGGAPALNQFDVRYFNTAGANIEPVANSRLDLVLVGDLSSSR